jgi:AcrR family transcriptional regulator
MGPKTSRQSKLDRELVIDAATALADAEGLDAISIRRLAEQFGVTPMALYWHFEDKDALLAAIGDRIWLETAQTLERSLDDLDPVDDGWGQLSLTLGALLEAMRRHPAVAELVPKRVIECEPGLYVTDLTLGFLAGHGFQPAHAADLARYVLCAVVMLVTATPELAHPDASERAEHMRHHRIALASLSPERYPHVVAAADYLTDCDLPDSYFARGLEAIIGGVRAQAPVSRAER